MLELYGDGIRDDTAAIQSMIDSGVCELNLPAPKKYYLISKPLELPSNFRLVLPRYAEIKLADNSSCVMLKNKTMPARPDAPEYPFVAKFYEYLAKYAPDFPCENIEVCGGIWNCNNLGQRPNPQQSNIYDGYSGFGMLFYNVKNIKIHSLTVKDPVTYAINLDCTSYFTVEDICFDFNYGNPCAVNMDGVHVNGNCHYGLIQNLYGTCFDDMVALNADEGISGPITNVEVSGIKAENSHSAVRLLACAEKIENIHIHDVYGTYYQYCIGLTKYYQREPIGHFEGITIDNVFASKADRLSVYQKDGTYVYPLIYMENDVTIKDVSISNVRRKEKSTPVATLYLGHNACAESISISRVSVENKTGKKMPMFVNNGSIKELYLSKIQTCGDDALVNYGEIKRIL